MKANMCATLAAAVIAVTTLTVGSAARSEIDAPAEAADLKRYCKGFGGYFERGWRYNDGGVQWGAHSTCFLPAGRVVCQDGACRSFRHYATKPETTVGSAEFQARPDFVAAALSNLARK